MWRRAIGRKSMFWFCGFLVVSLFVIAPDGKASVGLVSLATLLPAVFMITDWNNSDARKGILSVTSRGHAQNKVMLAEITLPALAGIVLAGTVALLEGAHSVWQFWVVLPVVSTSFTAVLLLTEKYFRFAGRTVLGFLWLTGTSRVWAGSRFSSFFHFMNYPGAVLSADPASGSPHPDNYVLASLVVIILVSVLFATVLKKSH